MKTMWIPLFIGAAVGSLITAFVFINSNKSVPTSTANNVTEVPTHTEHNNPKLESLTGDAFDKAFIEMMIDHHQGAIDAANLAKTNALHNEIKVLSDEIIEAQATEINEMRKWQNEWGYIGRHEGH